MTKKKRIVLIGPIPPPTGGVSIHIWRLYQMLKNDFEISFVDEFKTSKPGYFNLRSFNLFRYFLIILKSDAVFIHSGTNVLRMFHIVAAKMLFKKTVITFHAYPKEKSSWRRKVQEYVFSLPDKIIIVNADIAERISLPAEKVVVKHAFLPPVLDEEKDLPVTVSEWLAEARRNGKTIICSNAWRLDRWENQDLYGVDMCIEVTRRLKNSGIPVTFIFNIATIDKFGAEFENYQSEISHLELKDSFHLVNEQLSFVKLMQRSDLVVRPTNTDGDSLSIREALYLGKPIITSDIVKRPEGSIIHANRNIDDFELKLRETIATVSEKQNLNGNHQDLSYYTFYKNIFQDLLK